MSDKPNLPLGDIAGYDQGKLKKTEVADKSGVSAHDKLLATVAGGQVNLKVGWRWTAVDFRVRFAHEDFHTSRCMYESSCTIESSIMEHGTWFVNGEQCSDIERNS